MGRGDLLLQKSKELLSKCGKYKKILFIGIGFFGVISITVFASSSSNKYISNSEFQHDLNYYLENKYSKDIKEKSTLLPMNAFKKDYFLSGNKHIQLVSNSSYYLTQKDISSNNISTKNIIAQYAYLQGNKELIEKNIENVNPDKVAYLTFDDGPSQNTLELLNILDKHNIKGNFFFTASNMEENSDIVKTTIENGHTVGLQSYSNSLKIYSSKDSIINDFNKSQEVYEDITGNETNIIRLPYGSKATSKKENIEALTSEGYKIWDWNVDSNDSNYKGKTKEAIIEYIQKSINSNNNKLVILMHEKNQTIEALDTIIKNLKEAGYVIKPITIKTEAYNHWNMK